MPHPILEQLRQFVIHEAEASLAKLMIVWEKALTEKLQNGESQHFRYLEYQRGSDMIVAYLGDNESRFREGDLLCIHYGNALNERFIQQVSLDREYDDYWLLSGFEIKNQFEHYTQKQCYADEDNLDLSQYFFKAIDDVSKERIGREVIIPILDESRELDVNDADAKYIQTILENSRYNQKQRLAITLAYSTMEVACIQGPPGTGKTAVIAELVKQMVDRGERILLTSHTHMAINNALNKIADKGVATVKVANTNFTQGIENKNIALHEKIINWTDRPKGGFVVGATPFATCTKRLQGEVFDTIIFDEASQVTIPLAIMAMRVGAKYIFVGDQKQLPPVVLSKSILDKNTHAIFSRLVHANSDFTVTLDQTYRMNQCLSKWPSDRFYQGKLKATGDNCERRFSLNRPSHKYPLILGEKHSSIFIPSSDRQSYTRSRHDAKLVIELCAEAVESGITLKQIAVVTPFRRQGRLIRNLAKEQFGSIVAKKLVADTVERMQGQEREMIIVSLVAGNSIFLANIAGFFFQPERLNVSITRAKTKLIVIGPDIPHYFNAEDEVIQEWIELYRAFITHCHRVELRHGDTNSKSIITNRAEEITNTEMF